MQRDTKTDPSKRSLAAAIALTLAWGALSRLALDAHNYADAEDALRYVKAIAARDFRDFDAASSGWQFACAGVDALLPHPHRDPAASAKLVAKLAGTLLLPLLLCTLVRMTGRVALSLGLTLLFSAAFAPWWYSLMPDKYVPQLLLLGLVLLLALAREQTPSARFLIGFGLLCSVAMVVHTLSGLIALSLLPLLLERARTHGAASALSGGALSAGVMLCAGCGYFVLLVALVVRPESGAEGVRWTLSYLAVPSEQRSWGELRAAAPLLALIGAARSLFSLDFLLGHPALARAAQRAFPDKILVEEQHVVAHMPAWVLHAGPWLLGSAALAFLAVLLCALPGLRGLRGPQAHRARRLLLVVACWLVPTALFIGWWEPANNEFWIAPLYGLVLLIGVLLAAHPAKRRVEALVFGCALLLAGSSFTLGIRPRLPPHSDYWWVRQRPLARLAAHGDMIVEYGNLAADYLRLLGPAHVVEVSTRKHDAVTLRGMLRAELDEHPRTRAVYVTEMVVRASESPCGTPAHERLQVERFFRSLPKPSAWVELDGRRVARYDAKRLRAALE